MTPIAMLLSLTLGQAPLLTLDDAIREAEALNPDLAAARAQLAAAQEASEKAWSQYLPKIQLGASFTRNNAAPPAIQVPLPSGEVVSIELMKLNQLGAQLSASQPLFIPALWSTIDAAGKAEEAAQLGWEALRREVLFATTELYFGALSLSQIEAIQTRALEARRAHEQDSEIRFTAGSTPKLALLRAQIDRSRAEQDLKRARNAAEGARAALAMMLGREDTAFELTPPRIAPLPSEPRGVRPDIEAARLEVEIAQSVRSAAGWSYAPSVLLNGVYNLSNFKGFTGSYQSWALSVAASWTLFDGGGREAGVREAAARLVQARETLRAARLKQTAEMRRAALDLDSARSNRTKAQETVLLARENMQLVELNLRTGTLTPLELSDASTALTAAELSLITENLNADLAALRLLKIAGSYHP